MLALRLLLRNARGGEVKLLAFALILAVAVVSGIAIFADRLDRTLVQESNAFLGADLMVSGTQVMHIQDEKHIEEHPYTRPARLYQGQLTYDATRGEPLNAKERSQGIQQQMDL